MIGRLKSTQTEIMKRILSTVGLGLAVLLLTGALALSCFVLPPLWASDATMALKLFISSSLSILIGLLSYFTLSLYGRQNDRKRVVFGAIYGLILTVATLAGIEFLSSFYAPAWPARALLSIPPPNPVAATPQTTAGQSWSPSFNSWGMRDSERTMSKPAASGPRVVFVGDSFVESGFTPLSLPAAVDKQAAAAGLKIEAVNLGVSATNPRSYYYRIRDVALRLSPDALLLFIYAGNDFIAANDGYSIWPHLVDESPGSSVLGTIMPRTNWLLVNRLRLAEFLHGKPSPPGETEMLEDDLNAPPAERLERLVAHVKTYYRPDLPDAKIREVLSRGDGRLWHTAEKHTSEQEYLMGWMLDWLMSWETGTFDVAKSREDAPRKATVGEMHATLSWIEAADRLTRRHNVPLLVFLVPVGSVDPDYVEFWKPWPRVYSWSYVCDEWQSQLAAALNKTKVRFVDLRENLNGDPGTYRKLDGHWTQKGEAVVAARVEKELERLLEAHKTFNSKP